MHPFPCSIIKHPSIRQERKKTLWNRAGLFPQLNFTYKVAPSGMLMFSFSVIKNLSVLLDDYSYLLYECLQFYNQGTRT